MVPALLIVPAPADAPPQPPAQAPGSAGVFARMVESELGPGETGVAPVGKSTGRHAKLAATEHDAVPIPAGVAAVPSAPVPADPTLPVTAPAVPVLANEGALSTAVPGPGVDGLPPRRMTVAGASVAPHDPSVPRPGSPGPAPASGGGPSTSGPPRTMTVADAGVTPNDALVPCAGTPGPVMASGGGSSKAEPGSGVDGVTPRTRTVEWASLTPNDATTRPPLNPDPSTADPLPKPAVQTTSVRPRDETPDPGPDFGMQPLPGVVMVAHVPESTAFNPDPPPPAAPTPLPAPMVPHQTAPPALVSVDQTSIQLHLKPPDLGSIQVGISRPVDGPVHVQVTADTAATLQKLQHDRLTLHRALSQSGIATDAGMKLTFVIGDPAPVTARTVKPDTPGDAGLLPGRGGQDQPPPRRVRTKRRAGTEDEQPPQTVVDITA